MTTMALIIFCGKMKIIIITKMILIIMIIIIILIIIATIKISNRVNAMK